MPVSILVMVFITLIYPLAVWFGQGRVEPRFLALLLLPLALTRLHTLRMAEGRRWWLWGTLLILILVMWNNTFQPLKFYPVLVNTVMLGIFGYSLMFPPSIVERFARIRDPDLPTQAVHYTRRVTQIWCIFFAANGAVALMTALWASPATWTLYNGLIAYMMMGFLFAGEYFVRWRFKRRLNV
jgi:uncharacterized membrane protein